MVLLLGAAASYAEAARTNETDRTTTITPHFASLEEGQELMRGRTLYHEQINEGNLAFLLQKKGGTLDEYIGYAAEQVLPFTEQDPGWNSGNQASMKRRQGARAQSPHACSENR